MARVVSWIACDSCGALDSCILQANNLWLCIECKQCRDMGHEMVYAIEFSDWPQFCGWCFDCRGDGSSLD